MADKLKIVTMASIKWFISIASINFGMAAAGGQFVVLHFPPALHFGRGGTPIEGNVLKAVYLASLGFDFNETSDWNEMKVINPFRLPEAAVAVYVEGVSFLGDFDDDARIYPLESYDASTYEQVRLAMAQQEYEPSGKLVNMMLAGDRDIRSYSYIFGNITKTTFPEKDLKYSDKHYLRFESELQTLKDITASVNNGVIQPDGSSDFYSFQFTSLRNLCIYHGPDSKIMLDAKNLLNRQIQELNKAFVASYNGNVVSTAVITDSVNSLRQRRAAKCGKKCLVNCSTIKRHSITEFKASTKGPTDIAIINIIFFTCMALYLSLLAVIYTMATMDPGRDSIVYRMTSAIDRIKMEY